MDIKKLAPWNWFKKEEEGGGSVSVHRRRAGDRHALQPAAMSAPLQQLRAEMDRVFESVFGNMGLAPSLGSDLLPSMDTDGLLKPKVDIAATDDQYMITVEVPGVSEKDVSVEVSGNTMTIRGEKKQEQEEKDRNYYRIERSYGSFQRILSLPDDADQDNIKADFKNGVLSITMPRKSLPESEVKRIEIG